MVATVEMDFWDWAGKVAEKMTFIRLNVGSNRDITEEDYCLLECLYKIYYNGEYPIFHSKLALAEEKSVQSNLFSAITSDSTSISCDGTISEVVEAETKKEEKDDSEKE